jgi:hypothetical protein
MRLIDLPILRTVDERDIDFILLEEFHSDSKFVNWFVTNVGTSLPPFEFKGAWHSISDPKLGESDIVLLISSGTNDTAILIENKIDAPAQPEQSRRYKDRGLSGKVAANWKEFFTCIVAPKKYLDTHREAESYDAKVSYELIRDWLLSHTPSTARRDFRVKILDSAIEQNRRGRTRHNDERVAEFFRAFWDLAHREFSELEMTRSSDAAANNTWIEFRPPHWRDHYKQTYFYYKMGSGIIDIGFEGLQKDLARLRTENEDLLTDGVQLVARGKTTAALTAVAPKMDATFPFAGQIDKARDALKTALKLSFLKQFRIGM